MKPFSPFRLPILWLFLGPPAFRQFGVRSAMESLEGGQDIWNIIRLVWWIFWGGVAFWEVLRSQELLTSFLRSVRTMAWGVAVWLALLFASVLVSPGPGFTLVNAGLILIAVIAGLDLALKLYAGLVSFRAVLQTLLTFSTLLLIIVGICHFVDPSMVGYRLFSGVRIRGNAVAYTPLLSLVTFFVGLYLFLTSRHPARWGLLLVAGFGLWWLYLGQTRSAYLGFGFALAVFIWQWKGLGRNFVMTTTLVTLALLGLAGTAFMYGISHTIRWKVDAVIDRYVLRDESAIRDEDIAQENLGSLNGRTDVAAIVISTAYYRPLGLGFVSGPRALLQSDQVVQDLRSRAFGNAHNAFVEVLGGAGPFAFLAWMWVIGWVIFHARRVRGPDVLILRALFYVVLIQALFESNLVLPFKQSSPLFWMIVAYVGALTAHQMREEWLARQALFAPPPGDGAPAPMVYPIPPQPHQVP